MLPQYVSSVSEEPITEEFSIDTVAPIPDFLKSTRGDLNKDNESSNGYRE